MLLVGCYYFGLRMVLGFVFEKLNVVYNVKDYFIVVVVGV